MKILYENCDPKLAQNKRLPYTSYLVEYLKEGKLCYDLAMGNKQSEIFDHYWDNYKQDLQKMSQSGGQVNPNRWNDNMLEKPAKKKAKKATPPKKEEPKTEEGKDEGS